MSEKRSDGDRASDVEKSDITRVKTAEVHEAEGVDSIYEAKCALINDCLQNEIGFGRYQIELFLLSGFGWMADNIWLQAVAIVLPQIQQELNPTHVEFATLAIYAGLIVGAITWGVLADLIGRKLSWQITLFIGGLFGIAAGGAKSFTAFAALIACIGFGIGGNLPVDGALFLEHVPQSHQWTLTLLSAWWSLGQLVASVIAWGFIEKFSCDPSIPAGQCPESQNKGWRFTFFTLGALTFVMWLFRYVIFQLQESSKYLVAKGRDEEAIEVLQYLAKRNGKQITLTVDKLLADSGGNGVRVQRPSIWSVLKKSMSGFSLSHIKPLFSTRRLAVNSSITILLWGLIGLAYPLYNAFVTLYLEARVPAGSDSVTVTYRNYTIISVLGIPGSILACLLVDRTRGPKAGKLAFGGRKFAMALSTALTGVFLFLFTTSKTNAAVLGYSCVTSLTQNAMYGVLYAYTPEVFPAPHRGTADAICSAFNRITGILAPVIKITTSTSTSNANGPIFVSASLFLVASALMLLLPIETAGRAAL